MEHASSIDVLSISLPQISQDTGRTSMLDTRPLFECSMASDNGAADCND